MAANNNNMTALQSFVFEENANDEGYNGYNNGAFEVFKIHISTL